MRPIHHLSSLALIITLAVSGCGTREGVVLVSEEESLKVQKMTLEADEFFFFDSARLSDAAKAELDQVAASLRLTEYPAVFVTGHTDYLGSSEYNKRLSVERAENVAEYIRTQAGLPEGAVKARGVGFSQPAVDCFAYSGEAEKACLAPNRRVEVFFTAVSLVKTDTVTVVSQVSDGLKSMTTVEQFATQRVTPIGG